jgi:ppGpp synthetase/RelA/SpoT-type nucleotidyltranferase
MSIMGRARRYIVDTRVERHGKWPPFKRHTSRVKSAKRARCKAKRRGDQR